MLAKLTPLALYASFMMTFEVGYKDSVINISQQT